MEATGQKEKFSRDFLRSESIPNEDLLFGAGPSESGQETLSTKEQEGGTFAAFEEDDNVFEESEANQNKEVSGKELYIRSNSCNSDSGVHRRLRSVGSPGDRAVNLNSMEKRKLFRSSKDLELDDPNGPDVNLPSRRTQSLPDLVRGSKPRSKGKNKKMNSPDVIQQPTNMGAPQRRSGKKQLLRSVSFQEKLVYMENQEEGHAVLAAADETDEGYPETPSVEFRRSLSSSSDAGQKRRIFSEGYGTEGSGGSKASSLHSQDKPEVELEDVRNDSDTVMSEGSSSGSTATVSPQGDSNPTSLKQDSGDADLKTIQDDIPFLSIFGPSTSYDAPPKSTSASRPEGKIQMSDMQAQALIFRLSQEASRSAPTDNIPNFSMIDDESVQVSESQVAMVNKEDTLDQQRVIDEYVNTSNFTSEKSSRSCRAFDPSLDAKKILEGDHFDISFQKQTSQTNSDKEGISPDSWRKFMEQYSSPSAVTDLKLDRRELEEGSRCRDMNCTRQECQKFLVALNLVHDTLGQTEPRASLVETWCQSLWEHCQHCEDLRCGVLYCQQMLDWCAERPDTDEVLKKIQSFHLDPVLPSVHQGTGNHIQLRGGGSGSQLGDPLEQVPIARLGTKVSSAVLMFDSKSKITFVQKEYPLLEEGQQLAVYKRLKDVEHPHLVKQISLMEFLDIPTPQLHVSSQLMHGGSLKSHLVSSGSLTWEQTVYYIKQILEALQKLHQLGIVYLHWTCGNVFFKDTSRQIACLGNFSLSCPLGQDCWDIGGTKMCLPANIAPPELITQFTGTSVSEETDSWGVGCLLTEMLTGKPPWNHLRHDDRDIVHKRIHTEKRARHDEPTPGQIPVGFRPLLDSCFQEDPKQRPSVTKLIDYFRSIKLTGIQRVPVR